MNFKKVIRLFGIAVLLSGLIIMKSSAQGSSSVDGEQLYLSRCMSCHQVDGNGIEGVFPPLNEIDWVTGDKGRLIRITLDGAVGEYEIGDVIYSGAMPPWKNFLNDQEMAALLTYIRSAWDNDASSVTEDEVRLVREATKGRTQAWTAEELADEANQGIPGSFGFLLTPRDTIKSN